MAGLCLILCSNESGHVKHVSVVCRYLARTSESGQLRRAFSVGSDGWSCVLLSRLLHGIIRGVDILIVIAHVKKARLSRRGDTTARDPENRIRREENRMALRKNPHAVALGRLGGKKGGPARAAKLTPEQRRESAQKAGLASGKARMTSLTAKQRSAIGRKAALARWGG